MNKNLFLFLVVVLLSGCVSKQPYICLVSEFDYFLYNFSVDGLNSLTIGHNLMEKTDMIYQFRDENNKTSTFEKNKSTSINLNLAKLNITHGNYTLKISCSDCYYTEILTGRTNGSIPKETKRACLNIINNSLKSDSLYFGPSGFNQQLRKVGYLDSFSLDIKVKKH